LAMPDIIVAALPKWWCAAGHRFQMRVCLAGFCSIECPRKADPLL
jgi:hypothetical protein